MLNQGTLFRQVHSEPMGGSKSELRAKSSQEWTGADHELEAKAILMARDHIQVGVLGKVVGWQ